MFAMCAILVCFFISVFLISSFLHRQCLCHVSHSPPHSSGVNFFAAAVKGRWWLALRDYPGVPTVPNVPIHNFLSRVRTPKMWIGDNYWKYFGKPLWICCCFGGNPWMIHRHILVYFWRQKIPHSQAAKVDLGSIGEIIRGAESCLKYSRVNRPIWDEPPIIATKIANFCSAAKTEHRIR